MDNIILDGNSMLIPTEIDIKLTELADISYKQIEEALDKNGNTAGCHQPLLYVISRLVEEGKVKSILEFGSGASTILFAALKKKYNIRVDSYEDYPQWYQVAKKSIEYLGLPSDVLNSLNFKRTPLKTFLDTKYDLVFFDSSDYLPRYRHLPILVKRFIKDSTILICDDCQIDGHFQQFSEACNKAGYQKPKLFMSETRGEAVVDPQNLINFVKYKGE